MGRARVANKRVVVGARVPPHVRRALEELAARRGVSLSRLAAEVLAASVTLVSGPEGAPPPPTVRPKR